MRTPLEHEHFAAHRELEAKLKASVRGDVLFDRASRALYAADASHYRQLPIGVVYPRDAADEYRKGRCRSVHRTPGQEPGGLRQCGGCRRGQVIPGNLERFPDLHPAFDSQSAVAEANRMDEALGQARAKKLFRRPRLA